MVIAWVTVRVVNRANVGTIALGNGTRFLRISNDNGITKQIWSAHFGHWCDLFLLGSHHASLGRKLLTANRCISLGQKAP